VHKYIGIDPSINHTGWAVVHDKKLIDSGVIKQKPKDGNARYMGLFRSLREKLQHVVGDRGEEYVAAIEQPTYENSDRGRQAARAWSLVKLHGAFVACICACHSIGVRTAYPTPSQWKRKFTGPKIRSRVNQLCPEKEDQWESFDEVEAAALCYWYRKRISEEKELEVYG